MNIDEIREYCLSKKAVTESFPFDEVTLVFKVLDKMFLLSNLDGDLSINIKCDPENALELRASYPDTVLPGFHMNKKHWNTIKMNSTVNDDLVKQWIDDSYSLVVSKMTKKQQGKILNQK
ncbi:MAG: MmcQ/YjbR family DNA-binding protein [Bacteroidota bacterium]|nr:MmcQ/YjbR family DNA-binding protein [Bacteroidota bacterium]